MRFSGPAAQPAQAEDSCQVYQQLVRGAPICANPGCALHVRRVDAQVVEGGGNRALLTDGCLFGRGRYGQLLPCDAGKRRGPLRLRPGTLRR